MTDPETWAQGEIVRTLVGLTKSFNDLRDELRTEIRGLDSRFVSRELFDLTKADLEGALARLATTEKEHKELEKSTAQRLTEMVSKKTVYALFSLLATFMLAGVTWWAAYHH